MDKNRWDTPRKRPVSLNAWVFQSTISTFRPPLPFSMLWQLGMCSSGMSVQIILKINWSSSTALMLICSYCSVILLAQNMEGAKDWLRWACEWMNEKYQLFISQYITVVRPWVRIYHCQKWIGTQNFHQCAICCLHFWLYKWLPSRTLLWSVKTSINFCKSSVDYMPPNSNYIQGAQFYSTKT